MAVTDIRVDLGFPDHPKTRRLVARCGEAAVRCLLRVWSYAARYHPDGRLLSDQIEEIADWHGQPGEFLAALLDLRLLDQSSSSVVYLHDWQRHNRWAYMSPVRDERSRRAARARWSSCRKDVITSSTTSDTVSRNDNYNHSRARKLIRQLADRVSPSQPNEIKNKNATSNTTSTATDMHPALEVNKCVDIIDKNATSNACRNACVPFSMAVFGSVSTRNDRPKMLVAMPPSLPYNNKEDALGRDILTDVPASALPNTNTDEEAKTCYQKSQQIDPCPLRQKYLSTSVQKMIKRIPKCNACSKLFPLGEEIREERRPQD